MRTLRQPSFAARVAVAVCVAGLAGCSPSDPPTGPASSGGSAGTGNTGADGGTGNSAGSVPTGGTSSAGTSAGGSTGGGPAGSGGGVTLPPGTEHPSLLPARIRRMTNAEYAASVKALLGVDLPADVAFPPDSRQDGFTRNDAQRVDPVFAIELDQTAIAVAAAARPRFGEIAPCADGEPGDACAQAFMASFGERAYRRPLTDAEKAGLLTVYQTGAEGADYADGIELVIRAVLQSAGFLYVTELGDGSASDPIVLAPHEVAASLSYLILAEPPDATLMEAVRTGALATPEERLAQADRLLASAGPVPPTVLRTLREWLGVDRIGQIAKDSNVYPTFETLKPEIAAEPDAFFTHLIAESTGTVGELFAADWTVAGPNLADFYGVPRAAGGTGRVSLAGTTRRGLLNQAAFLAVNAHAHESAPVFRGVEVLKRVMCRPPLSPTALNIMVVPPVPDPNKTTRERFEIHSTDPSCAGCHLEIDGVGFTFEGFDGMGEARTTEGDAQIPIDSSTVLAVESPFDGEYPDSAALALVLSQSAEVRACFARHLFRSAAARSDTGVKPTEDAFVAEWQANALAEGGNIIESLRAYIASPLFAYRRAQ
jgi:hypothetical protein